MNSYQQALRTDTQAAWLRSRQSRARMATAQVQTRPDPGGDGVTRAEIEETLREFAEKISAHARSPIGMAQAERSTLLNCL